MRLVSSVVLLIATVAAGCQGSDVKIISIDDGAVAGGLSPSLFAKYRDMVIGIDEVHGRVAVIEWGDSRSTLKIVTVKPWQVSKHSIPVGRLTGLDGPMSFDFANNRFVYATDMYAKEKQGTIVTIGLNDKGGEQRYSVPLSKNYVIGRIIASPEGIFLEAGKNEGDNLGFRIYRIASNTDSAKEIYRSDGRLWVFGGSGKDLCFVDDPENSAANVRLILMNRTSLVATERALKWPSYEYAQSKEWIVKLSRDKKTLRRIRIASPGDAREFNVPPPKAGYLIYGLACSQDFALLAEGDNVNVHRIAVIFDFRTGRTREMNISGYQAHIKTLRCGGKDYAILSQ
jgi:hypothetical protein